MIRATVHSTHTSDTAELPGVRTIAPADLRRALRLGWEDFLAKRGDVLFVGVLYPLIGLFVAAVTLEGALLPLFFPLVAGLSIVGPLVAAGFYEIAKRRAEGKEAGWSHFLDPLRPARRHGILAIGAMLIMLFFAWLLIAWTLYQATLGRLEPRGLGGFLHALFTTPEGWTLIVLGNAVGACIAALTLALTVVSVPMVVDKPVSGITAVRTSIRAVSANPMAMSRWGLMVALILAAACIPLFVGLAVALPVLGYATWHLYDMLVER
ncbi:Uncharacterized membrane protein [Sphingomonas sp. OV641]|nr:Uncharacterized membrane protein [Sphingomonas sp. OV641]